MEVGLSVLIRRKIKLRKKSVLKKLSKKQFMLMKIRSSNQNKTKRILIMMRMSKTLFQMKSLRKSKLKRQNLPLKRHRQLAQRLLPFALLRVSVGAFLTLSPFRTISVCAGTFCRIHLPPLLWLAGCHCFVC